MRHDILIADSPLTIDALPLDVAVVVPTLNEAANVEKLIAKLSVVLAGRGWEVLFVDDNSADGTSELVRRIARESRHVRIVQRVGRRGLSSAVVEGILATAAPIVAVMDGDLQHSEETLPRLIDAIADGAADIAVGTRYVAGGGIGDWDRDRARMSRLATRAGQIALGTDVSDPMSGFFAVRRDAFERALPRLSAVGFKILLDILASSPVPLKVAEIPYQFRTREAGESKLGVRVIAEYAELIADKTIGRVVPVRLIKFLMVGGLGVFVHLAVLRMILGAGSAFFTAQTAAVMTAIAFNFFLNNSFTYADRKLRGWRLFGGLASFYAISALGAVANIGIGTWMAGQDERWWVAGVAGVVVGAIWNFAMSSALTWRK
ncbi:glycosyltransferase family 2 protein [Sphingopyxis sp. SE2]|jgi:dolichol-phosphate mannosyltransferase|uniref:glycosyltransferase n=1 Tax=unclassified Sphingopyxis TaxID=2614943 RepID=UPI00050E44AA|nr:MULTISPECIES: glycosyltransferase family 2 protein [unclassified Sphingopyxis]KGB58886.1 putative glycosyltransferase [Sphingopyxis sp. LC363]MDT7530672.1 glycosyltransferase family 2 protein [Sphingopyxis sp. SE2]